MKLIIERFGPIKKFEYDISKDLIITYGDNNIGKSYSMQIVYILLKSFIEISNDRLYSKYRLNNVVLKLRSMIKNKLLEFDSSDFLEIEITQFISDLSINIFSWSFFDSFINSCNNTFGNMEGIFNQKPIISLSIMDYMLEIDLYSQKISGTFNIDKTVLKKISSDRQKQRKSPGKHSIYLCKEFETPTELIEKESFLSVYKFIKFFKMELGNVFYLPASRSGIYSGMSAFGSIIAELSKNKAMLTKKIELPGISEPISDYFIMLSNIKPREDERLSDIYSEIENNILKGKVGFNRNKNTLVYTPENIDHEFEMTEVSSMVSEISPIVAYLKYIMYPNLNARLYKQNNPCIVFIEEPEAHLHPKNQIALIEVFSKLHKYNIKLIISSHSNYIFNKLNNLVLSKALSYDIYSPILLLETSEGSISKELKIDDLGVEDENFLDVSEQLYNERERIIFDINSKG